MFYNFMVETVKLPKDFLHFLFAPTHFYFEIAALHPIIMRIIRTKVWWLFSIRILC